MCTMKVSRMNIGRTKGGFTLIEILLAIGILAILATAAIIAINPARQFAQARNTQRWNDIHAIMNAVYQYSVGNKGLIPSGIPIGEIIEICRFDAISCDGAYAMSDLTNGSKYLTSIPTDPACASGCPEGSNGSGYFISANSDGRVVVLAPNAELGETIELVR